MASSVSETVTLVTAIFGSMGVGGFLGQAITGIRKIMSGVSSREHERREDLVKAREAADRRASAADVRADGYEQSANIERNNRYKADEVIAEMRAELIALNVPMEKLPARPVYEDTLTRAQINKLIAAETKRKSRRPR